MNDEQKLHWVFVQELNHNYTPFVSFLFEFSIFCSSTLLANKGSSRGSIPSRVGASGSKEQFSSRITLLRSSPWRSWWRFRMGLVVDRSRCKGPKFTVYLLSMVHYLKKTIFFSLQSQSSILLTSDFNKFLLYITAWKWKVMYLTIVFFLLIHIKEISFNYEICRILKHQRLY